MIKERSVSTPWEENKRERNVGGGGGGAGKKRNFININRSYGHCLYFDSFRFSSIFSIRL